MAEKKEVEKTYKKVEVTTQTSPAIQDVKNNIVLSLDDAIIEILNKLDEIKRAIV